MTSHLSASAFDAAIVDLDGTMVDTLGDFEVALNLMLTELSLPPVNRAQVETRVGNGSENLIQSVLMLSGATKSAIEKEAIFAAGIKKNEAESREIQKQAGELEKKVEEKGKEAESHEHRHHILTLAVTFLHVSIAVATLAIVIKGQRWPWYGALALGIVGILTTAQAYF